MQGFGWYNQSNTAEHLRPLDSDCQQKKVRMKGLEPPRLSAPDPKSGAATNYATSAGLPKKVGKDRVKSPNPKV